MMFGVAETPEPRARTHCQGACRRSDANSSQMVVKIWLSLFTGDSVVVLMPPVAVMVVEVSEVMGLGSVELLLLGWVVWLLVIMMIFIVI